jgi:hypothetical protein
VYVFGRFDCWHRFTTRQSVTRCILFCNESNFYNSAHSYLNVRIISYVDNVSVSPQFEAEAPNEVVRKIGRNISDGHNLSARIPLI